MKLAALDIGTNTVLMLVVEQEADGKLRKLADFSRITRLGRGVDAKRRLDPDAASRTLDAVTEFVHQARSLGVGTIIGVATAALRDAADGLEFLNRVRERAGVELEIISGKDEAELSYLSTMRGLNLDPSKRLLVVDIGGGSTELIRAEPGSGLEMVSLQLGAVRLTERFVHHDPPLAREAADLRLAVDEGLQSLKWDFHPEIMVGIAGTVTTVCAVALGLEKYDANLVHGHQLSKQAVLDAIGRFGQLTLDERKRLPGIEAGRADVIFAGAAILERIMAHFGLETVIVSDQGVRWGLVWRELERGRSPGAAPESNA